MRTSVLIAFAIFLAITLTDAQGASDPTASPVEKFSTIGNTSSIAAVPEPDSVWLAALSMVGFLGILRRRR